MICNKANQHNKANQFRYPLQNTPNQGKVIHRIQNASNKRECNTSNNGSEQDQEHGINLPETLKIQILQSRQALIESLQKLRN